RKGRNGSGREEEVGLGGNGLSQLRSKVRSSLVARPIKACDRLLAGAVGDLGALHRAEPPIHMFPPGGTRTHSTPPARSKSVFLRSVFSIRRWKVNSAATYCRPVFPSASAKPGFRSNRKSASAKAAESSAGTSNPVLPSSMISALPPTRLAIVGRPAA